MIILRPYGSTFIPMRMNKSGTFNITTTASKVTGWIADGSYSGTQIVSDELVMTGAAVVNISCQAAGDKYLTDSVTIQIRKNGTTIGSVASTTGYDYSLSTSVNSHSVSAGDTISMWALQSGGVNLISGFLQVVLS